MNPLIQKAIRKADEVRRVLGLDIYEPVDVFSACEVFGVTVRFFEISMEGFYFKNSFGRAEISLSSLRPFPRRKFSCGHEFGHYLFGHGTKVDALKLDNAQEGYYDTDELLVDAFSGALLMPIAGVMFEFSRRNWKINANHPIQFFTISSVFGVGYRTLITHCRTNGLISYGTANMLLKVQPAQILTQLLGKGVRNSYFLIADSNYDHKAIDLEVSDYLIMDKSISVCKGHLDKVNEIPMGIVYIALSPGITIATKGDIQFNINTQRKNYAGLSEYRNLEEIEE